ncbi:hypothetical protein SDC9_148960 [bioreactor metagenome]|uniref:Uncharacterized protein n=1 Tax=bioreactor metagenome TaxID=1076179 RepID=A0A645EIB5_9ZZZZ|nr:hypothetical protein [Anaerotignum propionicum]MEA5058091.1 hypothetical protein [Anaerotignum propionicum]
MKQSISHKELNGYLDLLRDTMTDGRNFPPAHVLFFDSRSFYYYFAKCPCGNKTVEEILLQMESCIPLAITEESLQLFLSAYKEKDSNYFAHSFLESSKADFLLLIRHTAEDEGKWHAVINLCDGLRQKNLC